MSFELDPEFINLLAEVATDALIEGDFKVGLVLDGKGEEQPFRMPSNTITIDVEELDLEAMITSEAGFVDPLGQLKQFITDLINSAISWVSESISGAVKGFIDWLWEQVNAGLSSISSWIQEATTQLQNLGSAFTGFVNAILKFPEWFPSWFYENIAKPISDALSGLAKTIWELLPDWLKNAIQAIRDALKTIPNTIKAIKDTLKGIPSAIDDLVKALRNFFKDPVGVLRSAFIILAERIWELLPDWLKSAIQSLDSSIKAITEGASWLVEQLKAFLQNPTGTLSALFSQISSIVTGMMETITDWIKGALGKVVELSTTITKAVLDEGTKLAEKLVKIGKSISEAISKLIQELVKGMIEPLRESIKSALEGIFGEKQGQAGGEIGAILGVGIALLPSYLTVLMLPRILKTLSHYMKEFRIWLQAQLAPLGVGGTVVVNIVSSFTRALYELGDAIEDLPRKMGEYFVLGVSLMGLEPLRYPFRYAWKQYLKTLGFGDVPFELPPLGLARDLIRRLGIKEASERFATILAYRGYPDWFIDNFTKLENELFIKVKDRFGKERRVPLGLLYAQPSLSTLIDMMIRDIFGAGPEGLEQFTKWAYRLGLYKDVAYMIYLLHFRYPTPRRLWDFVSRGLAGILWYVPSDAEINSAQEEAKAIGAHAPVPPVALNFKPSKLFGALTSYMKWHDYARFAWIKDFTSDNWMIIDTLADIPTKIDIRWMTKWAIFDFMASKEVKLESPASDFIKIVEDRPTNEKVLMNLTLMCRLLQATGLHPYYVPVVAVAETINALADERTLLRTGIINLYEYGAITYSELDKLMASLVIASFAVAYFDIKEGKWKTGYVNLPVAYLPAERKLLALRAVIDRYIRVFRDSLSDIERAYTEFIIGSEEVSKRLKNVIKAINEAFSKATADIVGREIKLALDNAFIEATLEAWKVARDIYTVRRIRSWVYRVLGWVIYRTAYGYVTEEDAKKVAKTLASIAKLPKQEASAIEKILVQMVGIATREYQREYIPTPLTLASMAEYIPAVRMFANKVFEAKGVPPEWRSFWLQYIDIRPIVDEVRNVLSSVRRLYEYFMIDFDMFKKFLDVLKPYGYEDREIKLIIDDANLDRWYRAYRELVGTPRELVTMAEYSPLARRLALAEVKKRIDALPIDQEAKEFLYKLWEDYIRIRPVYDEVEREVTELITDYARGLLTWEQFNTLLEELKDWGIDEWEADAIRFLAMMRRRRYQLTGRVS